MRSVPARDPATGCYVYGVVPAGADLPPVQGIDDAPVELVDYDDIAAVVAEITLDRPPGRRAELMAHTAVVDALAAGGQVMPVQFGSIVDDRESVRQLLEAEHDRFADALARLAGCRQLNLRATYVEEQVLAELVRERPEIAELRRRTRDLPEGAVHPDLVRLGELVAHALDHKRDVDAPLVMAAVEPRVVAQRPRRGGGVEHLLDVALLVADDQVAGLEDDLEALAEAIHERIRLRLVGPVAPYDFVGEDAWV